MAFGLAYRERVEVLERAERALQRKSEELLRSNEELQRFAYVASHDLQEPLRTVEGLLGILERQMGELDESGREVMDRILDGTRRMQRLIRDLLAYAQVGRGSMHSEPVSMQEVMDQAVHNLERSIKENSAKVTLPASLPTVEGDLSQLVQLVQNLLGNALKFRSRQSPEICVEASEEGDKWCFSVADNGIGLPAEFADRIFQMFRRLHGVGHYEGTGIGLALCKRVTENHGGRIWVESEPGRGSTFFFTIPTVAQGSDSSRGDSRRSWAKDKLPV